MYFDKQQWQFYSFEMLKMTPRVGTCGCSGK